MEQEKKILILTAPLGQGHNAVSHALEQGFAEKNIPCAVLDIYEYISPHLKELVSKGYYYSMKSASLIKDVASNIYTHQDSRDYAEDTPLYASISNEIVASELYKFIKEYEPSCIICTMVFAAQAINVLKEKGAIQCPCIGIITDFTVQNYWEDVPMLEYIVVGSEFLRYPLHRRDISPERVLPYGIPIDTKFQTRHDQKEMRTRFGLDPEKKTLLIMSGGMGFGKMDDYLKEIDNCDIDLQYIVVCGSNQKLHKKVSEMELQKPHLILGFTHEVDLLMDASDCILTKPGGITTSESLAKELPMIMIDPLPGVEDRNVEFLLNNGAAMMANKTFTISDALHLMLDDDLRRNHILQRLKLLSKPDATRRLCDFVQQLLEK